MRRRKMALRIVFLFSPVSRVLSRPPSCVTSCSLAWSNMLPRVLEPSHRYLDFKMALRGDKTSGPLRLAFETTLPKSPLVRSRARISITMKAASSLQPVRGRTTKTFMLAFSIHKISGGVPAAVPVGQVQGEPAAVERRSVRGVGPRRAQPQPARP